MAATMEEITLIDGDNNIEYKIMLSSEDTLKARNDNKFVYSLLQRVKTKGNEDINESVVEELMDEPSRIPSCSEDSNLERKNQHVWTRAETVLLINLYKEYNEDFNNPRISAKQCWNVISKKMKDAGYEISSLKCSTKLQCLKRTYKSVSDHNKKSGNNRKHWEYYEIMNEIFSAKPWMKPVAIAGSNIANNTDTSNIDIENEEPKKVRKKRKANDVLEDYLEKSIQLKEEKERNAQKRHEEKMAYLKRIENLMTKTFKN